MYKFGKSVFYFYSIVILSVFILSVLSLYYFHRGPLSVSSMGSIVQASTSLNDLKKIDFISVEEQINKGEIPRVLNDIKMIKKKIDNLKVIDSSSDEYKGLQDSYINLKGSLSKLITIPAISSVFSVLGRKINLFEKFVFSNNWKTLTRISKRVGVKLGNVKVRTYSFNRLSSFLRSVTEDVRIMNRVTDSSVLSKQDKIIILSKIKSFKIELEILGNYTYELKATNKNTKVFKQAYIKWLNFLDPTITMQKIELERVSYTIYYALAMFSAMILFSLILGVYLFKKSTIKGQRIIESNIINSIKNGLISNENTLNNKMFTVDFFAKFEKYRSYIHKRMSFGNLFQEGVPFSAILLDENLNLIWGNSLFYEAWNIDKDKSRGEFITWNFLQKFTNLGEDDPVITALKNSVAGIYQIQVRLGADKDSFPYEMYVSPVEHDGVTAVMIFFYPLRSFEETISEQIKSIVGPVTKILDDLTVEGLNQDKMEKFNKDFEVAGIGKLYNKFVTYIDYKKGQDKGFMEDIESLENEIKDKYKLIDDIYKVLEDKVKNQILMFKNFSNLKNEIIKSVDLRREMEFAGEKSFNSIGRIVDYQKDIYNYSRGLEKHIDDIKASFVPVKNSKGSMKEVCGELDEFKSRITQSVNQMMVVEKSNDLSSDMIVNYLVKFKMEMKSLDKVFGKLSSEFIGLDVSLSKVDMIMDNKQGIKMDIDSYFTELDLNLKNDMDSLNSVIMTAGNIDESLIDILSGLYSNMKDGKTKLQNLSSLKEDSL